jgi:hypothetical protein
MFAIVGRASKRHITKAIGNLIIDKYWLLVLKAFVYQKLQKN